MHDRPAEPAALRPPGCLEREEYIEQAYFFKALAERMQRAMATQDLLVALKEELLSTTRLPLALDFLASELRHRGVISTAMEKLNHYFTPFQTFVVQEAESERGKFDFYVGLEILHREAKYRAEGATPQGVFLYQFEAICRNRLGYDRGLDAVSRDPIFNEDWRGWIQTVRRQIGLVDLADMLYVRSQHYRNQLLRDGDPDPRQLQPVLFGEKEGKIALANRHKDPLLLFAALERHLNYPTVPRPQRIDEQAQLLPLLARRLEKLEVRVKLLEEESRGGIDITRFYARPGEPPPPGLGPADAIGSGESL